LKSLARGGRLVTCGATSGHRGEIDLRVLFVKQQSLLGSYMGTRADLGAAVEGLASGRLKPAGGLRCCRSPARATRIAGSRRVSISGKLFSKRDTSLSRSRVKPFRPNPVDRGLTELTLEW
jgi:NADPH:quinone reductase-like Zn-dependent oxidoreductase